MSILQWKINYSKSLLKKKKEEKCNTSMSPKNKTKYIKFYNFFLLTR